MELYKRMLMLAVPYWHWLAIAMLSMIGVAACTGATAYIIKPILDDIFLEKNMAMLRLMPLLVLVLFAVRGLCSWSNSYFMGYVGLHVIARLRQQLYDHIQTLPFSFFDKVPTGVLMSRITHDVSTTQGAISDALTGLIKDTLSIIGLVAVIFYRDWRLAILALVVFPFAFLAIYKIGRKVRDITTKCQQNMAQISLTLHETITGNRIVKAFGMEEHEKKRFARNNARFLASMLKGVRTRSLSSPIMEFLGGIGVVCVVWYGGYNVIQGVSTPGNFFSFLAAVIMLYDPVKRLSSMNNTIQAGMAAAQRVYTVLDTRPEIEDRPGTRELAVTDYDIELRNVHFRYFEKAVLTDINLKVAAGEVVAIVGTSGSGKSTLVNLIPRFYEVTDGAVLIGGMDIRDVTVASLRSKIGIVTQQTILFNDTVRDNIAYGDIRKSEEEIIAAAKSANAYDFIMRLPKGFDTVIGEQGVFLSGGERQRICIARAILKDAPILILDEATSSLDSESELEVQRALENLMVGRTTILIAHRLSTIKNADRIIAISGGRIAEEGSHEDLLMTNGEYRRLYELQFSQYDPVAPAASA